IRKMALTQLHRHFCDLFDHRCRGLFTGMTFHLSSWTSNLEKRFLQSNVELQPPPTPDLNRYSGLASAISLRSEATD
ncbi:MAG TPA: hypothetical protein VNX46_03730, partial [Candidatus Acidoferrum sp.]|nr:hypothetical protein [Candidatus Acidoferrum sp.]